MVERKMYWFEISQRIWLTNHGASYLYRNWVIGKINHPGADAHAKSNEQNDIDFRQDDQHVCYVQESLRLFSAYHELGGESVEYRRRNSQYEWLAFLRKAFWKFQTRTHLRSKRFGVRISQKLHEVPFVPALFVVILKHVDEGACEKNENHANAEIEKTLI